MRVAILLIALSLFLNACGQQSESDIATTAKPVISDSPDEAKSELTSTEQAENQGPETRVNIRSIAESSSEDVSKLVGLASNSDRKVSHRLTAMRQLAELDQERALSLCARIARNPGVKEAKHARLLQNNAIAILVRAENSDDESVKQSCKNVLDDLSVSLPLKNIIHKLRKNTQEQQ